MNVTSPSPVKYLTLFTLVMLIVGSIDSIRNFPATALFGSSLIFFFIVSAVIFLIPVALVSAELASSWTQEGGIYNWVRLAFGEKWGFLAIWFQWINTMFWYPTILLFMAGTLAYFFYPGLAENKFYLVSFILSVFWIPTLVTLRGIHLSSIVISTFTIIGLFIPVILILVLAALWIINGKPLQISFSLHELIPNLRGSENWISLTAIMASFLGMELAAVHINKVRHPYRTFPIAMLFSVIIILITMIGGSLAIALVLPRETISLTSGVMQTFECFFAAYHLSWMMPVIVMMIFISALGGMINWVVSPAQGLLQAAKYGYLPAFLRRENKYGIASNILLMQAILINIICLVFLLIPSINGAYWLLTALSTQVYILMYVLMFTAAIRLRYSYPQQTRPFKIPGGNVGLWLVSLIGLIGCIVTLTVGFFPPSGIDVGTKLHYLIVFSGGLFLMIAPCLVFYGYKHRMAKKSASHSTLPTP